MVFVWGGFDCGGVFVAVPGLSLVSTSAATPWLQSMAFSLWWLLLLQSAGCIAVVHGLSCSVARLYLPRPGIEPMSSALVDGLLTTEPSAKSQEGF